MSGTIETHDVERWRNKWAESEEENRLLRAEVERLMKERDSTIERCAEVCEKLEADDPLEETGEWLDGRDACAAAIRALLEQPRSDD
jgi:hypothetical protein